MKFMIAERLTLDTNILFYVLDVSAGERHKRAKVLLQNVLQRDCVLTLQALAEFFSAATRKLQMPLAEARGQVEDWQSLFPIVLPEVDTINRAIAAVEQHRLSF
jgi:predicted nucleic acid-binding protein